MMSDLDLEVLIAAWLDGRISGADSQLLQQRLRESADARATFREFTKLDETIRCFEEICDGKWDHLPEQAFMYVGVIEQAEEQAKKAAAKAAS